MRKTPSLEKGNSDDKPSSEEKQPVEEKSNPPVQKKISMEKKESVDESSAPVVCLLYVHQNHHNYCTVYPEIFVLKKIVRLKIMCD